MQTLQSDANIRDAGKWEKYWLSDYLPDIKLILNMTNLFIFFVNYLLSI